MKVDVAVLGGGPGGYTSAIRAAQLGARVACIEREPELGGTCLRVGCIPTKAWMQTAFALKEVEETFDKLGVTTTGSHLEFSKANEWKSAVVKRMTQGVAFLFEANGVEWVKGTGTFTDANTIAVEGSDEVTFSSAIVATGSLPLRPPIEGLDSDRCVDSEGLLARTELPKRLVILGGGVIGCEFASIFRRFGSDVTIIEVLPSLIPQEDEDASRELARQFSKRGITLHLEKRCTKVEDSGLELTVHFGDGESVMADLMLVSVGRRPLVDGLGLEGIGVEFDRRTGIATDGHRRTTVPHIYAVGDCAGYWQLAHTAFREGAVAAENACGHDLSVDNRAVPRPIYTDPEIASVGLTEAAAREKYGDAVATGVFPWIANARAVMQNETVGWVKSIHETNDGELLGLVMVGPHVTDLVEGGVIAIDAKVNVETVADGMAAHPTLSEAIKEACLLALGRPIHVPNRSAKPDMADVSNPNDLRYHEEHGWARAQGDEATFGITWFAQDALHEVVFFDSPKVGDEVTKDRAYAQIESAKAVSDLIAPMSGEIVEVNDALDSAPETINQDPYGQGWLVKVKLSDPSEANLLMSAEEYAAMVE
jgi:dihydrolipoamide dehydrogenase